MLPPEVIEKLKREKEKREKEERERPALEMPLYPPEDSFNDHRRVDEDNEEKKPTRVVVIDLA